MRSGSDLDEVSSVEIFNLYNKTDLLNEVLCYTLRGDFFQSVLMVVDFSHKRRQCSGGEEEATTERDGLLKVSRK